MTTRGTSKLLTDVFVACSIDGMPAKTSTGGSVPPTDCLRLHHVRWQEARLSEDGKRLICRFSAPDAESVRIALRLSGIPFEAVWIA